RLWDVTRGRLVEVFAPPGPDVRAVAFSADGRRALSGGFDSLALWDVAQRQEVRSLVWPPAQGPKVVYASVSPDGRRGLTIRGDVLTVWRLPDLKVLATLEAHPGVPFPEGEYRRTDRDVRCAGV